jgi:hypothetical protein
MLARGTVRTMTRVHHWGVTGSSNEWAALDRPDDDYDDGLGGMGFKRVVEPGVVYVKPPEVEGLVPWGESPQSRGRQFQMAWDDDSVPEFRTLLDMQAELAPQRAALQKDDPRLQALDDAIVQMVRTADAVHRAGGTLGFVQPDSVLFCNQRDGTLRAVFPDIGFLWDDERGLREPKWIAEPQLDLLFEQGARRHNSARIKLAKAARQGQDATPKAEAQAEDVRLLARLVAVAIAGPDQVQEWCGDGRAFLSMPGRDRAPDTQAPIWDEVIAPALVGKVGSCADLAARLEAVRPSEHFLFKPPAPPPVWKKVVRKLRPALAIAAAIGCVLVGWWAWPKPQRHHLCPQVWSSSPLFARLDELNAARKTAMNEITIPAYRAYWTLLRGEGGLPEACGDKLTRECIDWIERASRGTIEGLRTRPVPRREELKQLEEALSLLQEAAALQPERCTRAVALLERQFRIRGEEPQAAPSRPLPTDQPAAAVTP